MKEGIRITEEEADLLQNEGVATFFDCACECPHKSDFNCKDCEGYHGFGGFFEAQPGARLNIILVITNEGYFIRAREDLVKSKDEVFVGFVEDGENPPNFGDIFEVRRG